MTVICACIRRRGGREVLLSLRRAPGVGGLDGKWELPGGKIEFGETPEEAVVREIQEEVGIRVIPLRLLPHLHTNRWEYEHASQQVLLACFECELADRNVDRLGDDVRWFPVEQINFASTLPGTREFVLLACNNEPLDRLYIRFESATSQPSAFKQFSLVTQPTLFSNYGLVTYWRGQRRSRGAIEEFDSARALNTRLLEITKRHLWAGYRIVELHGPAEQFEALQEVVADARKRDPLSGLQ